MMTGDDIQKRRQRAEEDVKLHSDIHDVAGLISYQNAHTSLALWVIAEQLYELRANFAILIERTEKKL